MADITVQVSSAGLTTTVGLLNQGWGRLTWGSIVWGEDFINVTVSVTTPSTPTTWGQSTFGSYSWNQINGVQSELGEESFIIDGSIILNTNLLNTTVNSITAGASAEVFASTNLITSTVNTVYAAADVYNAKLKACPEPESKSCTPPKSCSLKLLHTACTIAICCTPYSCYGDGELILIRNTPS